MDLSLLQALEREKVLEVLQRDKLLRNTEEDRIRKLKIELQEIRRKGAKNFSLQYSERTCARCQRPLGKFWNSGAVCQGCSHRICNRCRVGVSNLDWKCTVCHAYREVKIKSGDWFLEEKAKKYPHDTDSHETIGEKLLKSYQRLSQIAVVPPTPPPYYGSPTFNRYGEVKSMKKPFTKSMEDLMFSITSHVRKFSKSQEDLRLKQELLTVDKSRRPSIVQKSFSDTNINTSVINLSNVPSLPNLFKKGKNDDHSCSSSGGDEELSQSSENSELKRGGSFRSSGADSGFHEVSSVTGELELTVDFNDTTSCLEITVKCCRNLSCGDTKRKKCHPYVKVSLVLETTRCIKLRTPVKRNTTDPIYNEVLQFPLDRSLLTQSRLQATVWHSGTLKKKVFLGEVVIRLDGWMFEDGTAHSSCWYSLSPKPECPEGGAIESSSSGELLVRMKFSSLSQPTWDCHTDEVHIRLHDVGQLTVVVVGAKNLPAKSNTSQNTYIKGYLVLPGPRELVQKSPVLKRKPGPEWSHQLVFSKVKPSELHICTLNLELWDHTPFTRSDRLLGGAIMEAESSWRLVSQAPNIWHDFTLPVQTNAHGRRT
ncbi:hypothetical protein UPYG_G00275760 [Umbra pygmaea]|uniref:Synaptotagmin-like protein 3 n=1 Tax=Umbra pygmaea TaxID=75934 RepID=A0ABD0WL91_UMBPY